MKLGKRSVIVILILTSAHEERIIAQENTVMDEKSILLNNLAHKKK